MSSSSLIAEPLTMLGSPTSIHRCSKCDKPFASERSRDRHLRYCGTRTRRRQKSCLACGVAKSKCSFEAPCSRCFKKGLECSYTSSDSTTTTRIPLPTAHAVRQISASTPSSKGGAGAQESDNGATQGMLGDGDEGLFFDHHDCLALNVRSQQSPLAEIDNIGRRISSVVHAEFHQQGLGDESVTSSDAEVSQSPVWCKWTRQGLCLARMDPSYMIALHSGRNARLTQTPGQHNANVIIQALRAFPTMMLRKETWPWFIHPHSHMLSSSTCESTALPKALAACMGIAQMYILGTDETKTFVWQTIRTECARFVERLECMSEFEILTATQACMVYFIMCIVEASSENDALSLELLQILYELYGISKKLNDGQTYHTELAHPSSNWAGWIFAESRRRLTILWLLVGCVVRVKMNHAHDASQSHRSLPLPAPKLLWEASSERTWESEYEASRILQASGLNYLGDLIDAHNSKDWFSYGRTLDLWNASADNLGILLNLVHAMI